MKITDSLRMPCLLMKSLCMKLIKSGFMGIWKIRSPGRSNYCILWSNTKMVFAISDNAIYSPISLCRFYNQCVNYVTDIINRITGKGKPAGIFTKVFQIGNWIIIGLDFYPGPFLFAMKWQWKFKRGTWFWW